jgi:hypothetical protein
MVSRNRFAAFALAAAAALVATALPATSFAKARGSQQYAIEFSCGTADDSSAGVVPGDYETVVNVINSADRDVRARAMVILTFPRSAESDWVSTVFEPGQARSLDCDEILFGAFTFPRDLPSDGFYQGFLRIQAESHLSPVARYTTSGSAGEASSQVVQIQGTPTSMPKRRPGGGNEKVEICHIPPGNPDNAHTIEIDNSAVSAHLRHGDYRGECDDREHED